MQQHHRGEREGQDGHLAAEDADGLAEPEPPEASVPQQSPIGTGRCDASGAATGLSPGGDIGAGLNLGHRLSITN